MCRGSHRHHARVPSAAKTAAAPSAYAGRQRRNMDSVFERVPYHEASRACYVRWCRTAYSVCGGEVSTTMARFGVAATWAPAWDEAAGHVSGQSTFQRRLPPPRGDSSQLVCADGPGAPSIWAAPGSRVQRSDQGLTPQLVSGPPSCGCKPPHGEERRPSLGARTRCEKIRSPTNSR